jgi:hypothetical protein
MRSSKVVWWTASIAVYHVERAGENNAVWTKAIGMMAALIVRTELAEQVWLAIGGAVALVAGEVAIAS